MRAVAPFALMAMLLVASPLVPPAQARPLESELPLRRAACWERAYDEAHRKANPRQKIARIRLVHLPETWSGTPAQGIFVMLYMNLRQRTTSHDYDYQLSGFCKARGQDLHCVPEWEAGSWRISRGPHGTLDIHNHGIVANPNPYDAEEIADGAVKIPAKPDDGVWRLQPASGACRIE